MYIADRSLLAKHDKLYGNKILYAGVEKKQMNFDQESWFREGYRNNSFRLRNFQCDEEITAASLKAIFAKAEQQLANWFFF